MSDIYDSLPLTSIAATVLDVLGVNPPEGFAPANDIVTAVDDTQVTSADGLIITLREHEVGDTVTLAVVRDGSEQNIDVTLGSDEALQSEQQDNSTGSGAGNSLTEEELRQYLEDLLGGGQGYGQNGGQGF